MAYTGVAIKPFEKKIWLASPTMHGRELEFVREAYETNWMSTIGENITVIEREVARMIGAKCAVALSSGTAALHLAIRLAAQKVYGKSAPHVGSLAGKKVFASDMTFSATVNPIAYEGGEVVLIDSERESWNMDPEALEKAFALYPEVRLVVLAHLYGTPAKVAEIRNVCAAHGALLVEDAAESLGAEYLENGAFRQTGNLGDIGCISFNGNKIITGSSGGMVLTDSEEEAALIRQWSTQSREPAPWYLHEQLGYNYRMSNVIAGVVRGQLPYLNEHIARKRAIRERYQKGLAGLPVKLDPINETYTRPNFWLSCITIEPEAMCPQRRTEHEAFFEPQPGRSCPSEILSVLASHNAEGRPIWRPMHLQPMYSDHAFVSAQGDVGTDIFRRGLCLPSDIKMTVEQQDIIIELIRRCFD